MESYASRKLCTSTPVLADETDACVKACLSAERFSEPILVCSAVTAKVKKFVLYTQDIVLQLM